MMVVSNGTSPSENRGRLNYSSNSRISVSLSQSSSIRDRRRDDSVTVCSSTTFTTNSSQYSNLSGGSKKISKVSPRLLEPTASNIASVNKLIDSRINPQDDIWGTKTNAIKYGAIINQSHEKYDHIQSRLLEPTIASDASLRKETPEKSPKEESRSAKPINPDSRILAPTESFLSSLKSDARENHDHSDNGSDTQSISRRGSSRSGSSVLSESRLLEPTVSAWQKTQKAKLIQEADQLLREEEEILASKSTFKLKVHSTSERILQSTASWSQRVNSKLSSIPEEIVNDEQNSKKVKETSAHILEPNIATLNRQWRGSSSKDQLWTFKDPGTAPEHLLETTEAFERGKYRKPDVSPNPREIGWKSYFTSAGKIVIPELEEAPDVPVRSPLKVKEPSPHLLVPTLANEAYKNSWTRTPSSATQTITSLSANLRSRSSPRPTSKNDGAEDDASLNISMIPRRGSATSTITTIADDNHWSNSLELLTFTRKDAFLMLESDDISVSSIEKRSFRLSDKDSSNKYEKSPTTGNLRNILVEHGAASSGNEFSRRESDISSGTFSASSSFDGSPKYTPYTKFDISSVTSNVSSKSTTLHEVKKSLNTNNRVSPKESKFKQNGVGKINSVPNGFVRPTSSSFKESSSSRSRPNRSAVSASDPPVPDLNIDRRHGSVKDLVKIFSRASSRS